MKVSRTERMRLVVADGQDQSDAYVTASTTYDGIFFI